MKSLDRKDIGTLGEHVAARYLRRHKCKILAKNVHCGRNELDLIVRDGNCIAFVEVKTRTFDTAEAIDCRPASAVNSSKRRRTVEAARAYLQLHPTKLRPRLDVIEVYLDRSNRFKPFKIHHIPGAFDAKAIPH